MKKHIAALLVSLLVLSSAGCSGTPGMASSNELTLDTSEARRSIDNTELISLLWMEQTDVLATLDLDPETDLSSITDEDNIHGNYTNEPITIDGCETTPGFTYYYDHLVMIRYACSTEKIGISQAKNLLEVLESIYGEPTTHASINEDQVTGIGGYEKSELGSIANIDIIDESFDAYFEQWTLENLDEWYDIVDYPVTIDDITLTLSLELKDDGSAIIMLVALPTMSIDESATIETTTNDQE